ncbi:hypothetical protein COL922a_014747, partial [Colletotrichum nupharicola]
IFTVAHTINSRSFYRAWESPPSLCGATSPMTLPQPLTTAPRLSTLRPLETHVTTSLTLRPLQKSPTEKACLWWWTTPLVLADTLSVLLNTAPILSFTAPPSGLEATVQPLAVLSSTAASLTGERMQHASH